MKKIFWILPVLSFFISCKEKQPVDLIVFNAHIYTVDSAFNIAEAIAIKEGTIVQVGSTDELNERFEAKNKINAEGRFIYPGFIDAHAHFYRYGLGLRNVNLTGTKSWEEVIKILSKFSANNIDGWLSGRGWDQNDWTEKEFPSKEKLDELFPSRPVILTRVDGHAAIVNQRALDIAGIQPGQKITGGTIETENGKLTGLLIDNAIDLVSIHIPDATPQQIAASLLQGQKNCFEVGLTTVDDCGIGYTEALFMDSLQKKGELKMRIYAMLSDVKKNYDFLFSNGKIKTDRMHVRSFKVYADGALGSRGACLLEPYNDRKGWHGFLLSNPSHFDSVARIIYQHNFQMCTHAIGDSGNRAMLNIYAKYLKSKNDKRWRIEHAQVINKNDFHLFGLYSIIPSVQPTHATSDMYWAADRLGTERVKGAYAFKDLMNENGWIPLGTDFPVEDISPFKTFYAAVFRKDEKDFPAEGYQMENALTREQALRGMTIWAARSNFEEAEKGSLEKGKFADFIILDKDIMIMEAKEIPGMKVWATYLAGERVFGNE